MRREGSAMLRWSPRRTLEAIVSRAFAPNVALGKTHLKRSATKRAQSKASNCQAVTRARWQLSRPRGRSTDQKSCGGEVGGKAAVGGLFGLEVERRRIHSTSTDGADRLF